MSFLSSSSFAVISSLYLNVHSRSVRGSSVNIGPIHLSLKRSGFVLRVADPAQFLLRNEVIMLLYESKLNSDSEDVQDMILTQNFDNGYAYTR